MSAIAIGVPISGRSAIHQVATFRLCWRRARSSKPTGSFRARKRTERKRPLSDIPQRPLTEADYSAIVRHHPTLPRRELSMRLINSEKNNWGFGTDDRVNTVAGRLYGHHVGIVREEAATYDIQAERLRKTFSTARAEADRSAAILLFAMAEDVMSHGLKKHLRGQVAGGWEGICNGNGLLATANDRMTILALLGWVSPLVYADLRIMKSIRNCFAHNPDVTGFDDNKSRGFISSLSPREKDALLAARADAPLTARQLYLLRAGSTLTQLIHNLAIGPAARREHVSPEHASTSDWEQTPANLKELHRLEAEHYILVVG